jgi:rSAM/selenodomain-associated transferase 1
LPRITGVGPTLLVIAKSPVPGRVKTRLTPPCTPHEAAQLAGAALSDTLAAATRARRASRCVLVLDGAPGTWLPHDVEVVQQRGDGLAARLADAFQAAAGPAFLVGMDTPQVTPELLDAGLAAVEHADAAFGASYDGGYWGIGLRRPDPEAFRGVPMSAPSTAAFQRARLADLGLTTALLPPLRDVDTIADAHAVAAAAPDTRFAGTLATIWEQAA